MDNPLKPEQFGRVDANPDAEFYQIPRLLKHIDEPACAALARFYEGLLPADGLILDLMSSYASHLPEEQDYAGVIGLGMNGEELRKNVQLTGHVIHDLNRENAMPLADAQFDGCILAVSIQYLTKPIEVFRDVARVLRPGAPFAISYSNRMFPTKAVAIWRALGDADRAGLIDLYFQLSEQFEEPEVFNLSPHPGRSDPLFAVVGRRI